MKNIKNIALAVIVSLTSVSYAHAEAFDYPEADGARWVGMDVSVAVVDENKNALHRPLPIGAKFRIAIMSNGPHYGRQTYAAGLCGITIIYNNKIIAVPKTDILGPDSGVLPLVWDNGDGRGARYQWYSVPVERSKINEEDVNVVSVVGRYTWYSEPIKIKAEEVSYDDKRLLDAAGHKEVDPGQGGLKRAYIAGWADIGQTDYRSDEANCVVLSNPPDAVSGGKGWALLVTE